MWNESTFEAYMMRHYEVSMLEGNGSPYFVVLKDSVAQAPSGFTKMKLATVKYDLYVLQK